MLNEVDVIVSGAGPAGATLALLAARRGLRVALVERARFPRDKVCGEFLSAEGVAVLERLELLGCFDDAPPIDQVRITDGRGRPVDAPLPRLAAADGVGRGISRERLDLALLEAATRHGARLFERYETIAPLVEAGRVTGLRLRPVGRRDGAAVLRAPVVVAADGRRSPLVRGLAPRGGDPRRTGPRSWFGLKRHFSGGAERLGRRVELHVFDGGYAGLAPVDGARINLCLMTRVDALRAAGSPHALLEQRIRANPAVREMLAGAQPAGDWHSVGPLRWGVRQPELAGAICVGDAAGTIDPFCGEGMSHALLGAELAVPWVAAAATGGGLTAEQSRGWRRAWLAAFGTATRRARHVGRLLERPRLAAAALAVLAGPARAAAPRLVAATRTGR